MLTALALILSAPIPAETAPMPRIKTAVMVVVYNTDGKECGPAIEVAATKTTLYQSMMGGRRLDAVSVSGPDGTAVCFSGHVVPGANGVTVRFKPSDREPVSVPVTKYPFLAANMYLKVWQIESER